MDKAHIVKDWTQFIEKLIPLQGMTAKRTSPDAVGERALEPQGNDRDEARMAPYVPDFSDERDAFSLHLGC